MCHVDLALTTTLTTTKTITTTTATITTTTTTATVTITMVQTADVSQGDRREDVRHKNEVKIATRVALEAE